MNIQKKLTAFIAVALIAGAGIIGITGALYAQTQREQMRPEQERQEKRDRREKREESEADEQAEKARLAEQATISKEQAQAVALQNVPGEVLKGEPEDEDGAIIWEFKIRQADGKVVEAKVDAKNGSFIGAEQHEKGEKHKKGKEHRDDDDDDNEQGEAEND